MIAQHGEISSNKENYSRHNKDDITNASKAVVRKSILMQTIKPRPGNGFH
jgi:hypothetical protein